MYLPVTIHQKEQLLYMYLYQSFVSSHNFEYIHKINTPARLVGRASQYRKLTLKLHLTLGSDFELIIVGT